MLGEETVESVFEVKQHDLDRSRGSIDGSSDLHIPPNDKHY